jgi:hypothetical protein
VQDAAAQQEDISCGAHIVDPRAGRLSRHRIRLYSASFYKCHLHKISIEDDVKPINVLRRVTFCHTHLPAHGAAA